MLSNNNNNDNKDKWFDIIIEWVRTENLSTSDLIKRALQEKFVNSEKTLLSKLADHYEKILKASEEYNRERAFRNQPSVKNDLLATLTSFKNSPQHDYSTLTDEPNSNFAEKNVGVYKVSSPSQPSDSTRLAKLISDHQFTNRKRPNTEETELTAPQKIHASLTVKEGLQAFLNDHKQTVSPRLILSSSFLINKLLTASVDQSTANASAMQRINTLLAPDTNSHACKLLLIGWYNDTISILIKEKSAAEHTHNNFQQLINKQLIPLNFDRQLLQDRLIIFEASLNQAAQNEETIQLTVIIEALKFATTVSAYNKLPLLQVETGKPKIVTTLQDINTSPLPQPALSTPSLIPLQQTFFGTNTKPHFSYLYQYLINQLPHPISQPHAGAENYFNADSTLCTYLDLKNSDVENIRKAWQITKIQNNIVYLAISYRELYENLITGKQQDINVTVRRTPS